jgi:hypothetical protein
LRDAGLECSSIYIAKATIHPSAILRMPAADERQAHYAKFVTDLKLVQVQLPETRTCGGTSL